MVAKNPDSPENFVKSFDVLLAIQGVFPGRDGFHGTRDPSLKNFCQGLPGTLLRFRVGTSLPPGTQKRGRAVFRRIPDPRGEGFPVHFSQGASGSHEAYGQD